MESPKLDTVTSAGKKLLTKFGIMAAAAVAALFLFFQTIDSNQADSSVVLQSVTGNLRRSWWCWTSPKKEARWCSSPSQGI